MDVNENNEEILFTKDHITPRSKGGKNHISNYQTMCSKCNEGKEIIFRRSIIIYELLCICN